MCRAVKKKPVCPGNTLPKDEEKKEPAERKCRTMPWCDKAPGLAAGDEC